MAEDRPSTLQCCARRIRPIWLPKLRSDPANGPRDEERISFLNAKSAATDAGWPRLQGRRNVRAEYNNHPTHAGRGKRSLFHSCIRTGDGRKAKLQPGAAPSVRS